MIRSIIIDDERRGREILTALLREYCPEVEILGSADCVSSAIAAMYQHNPNLIFLDVEMPYENGFDLLEKTGDLSYDVIFTTAYDRYAIPAIKSNALDYLLKPIDSEELVRAVDKARSRGISSRIPAGSTIETALKNIEEWGNDQKTITLSTGEGMIRIRIHDIIRCSAEANYTRFHLSGRGDIIVSRTLKNFELLLSSDGFVRVHYSHLVNMRHVVKYLRGEGGQVVMSDGTAVLVSRRRKEDLMRAMAH